MSLETLKAQFPCGKAGATPDPYCPKCHGTGLDLAAIAAHIEALEKQIQTMHDNADARIGRAYRAAKKKQTNNWSGAVVRCADVERLAKGE